MATVWATIKVRTSLGLGLPGDAPAEVRKAAIDFESVYPRQVSFDTTSTAAAITAKLIEALQLKIALCDCPAFRFDMTVAPVGSIIDPDTPEVWTAVTGHRGAAIYAGADAGGTTAFVGFQIGT